MSDELELKMVVASGSHNRLGNPNGAFLDTTLSSHIFAKYIATSILPKRIIIINYDRVG